MVDQTSTQNTQTKTLEEELEEYLATQQGNGQNIESHPPMAAHAVQGGTEEPESPALRGDLLSQIAAVDIKKEKEQKKKKKKKQIAFSKLFSVFMMRTLLQVNRIRREYATLFQVMAFLWSAFVLLIYIGGIVSLGILVYVYANYPRYVRSYLENNHIELASWDMSNYTLSQIELKNIKSKDDSYAIRRVLIRSNFSDFLRGRIKAVTLEGTTLKIREKNNQFDVSGLIKVLMQLNNQNAKYHIGSISIPNATLNIEGEKYKLPVTLSITGVYDKTANITIPLSIKHKYMNISAQLVISGMNGHLDWALDITSGILTFPNQQPENLTGKLKITTEKTSVASVKGTLDMEYGKNTKKINIDLKQNKNLYRGSIGLSMANMEVRDKADETKTNIQMIFEGLDIKNFSRIVSSKPIRMNIQSVYTQDFSATNVIGLFKGDLDCHNFVCSYQIKSNASVNIQNTRINYQGNTYNSTEKTQLTLKPNNRKNLTLKNGQLEFDFSILNAVYAGTSNTKNNRIKLNAKAMELSGLLTNKNIESNLKLSADGLNYTSNEASFSNASIQVDNIWQEGSTLQFKSPSVTLTNNRLVKVPFSIEMRREKDVLGASLALLGNKVQIRYVGSANLSTGSFSGNIAVLPFNLKNISVNLNTVSDIFPKFIEKASGTIAVYGKIAWKSEKQVAGPFYLMAENVNFDAGDIKVKDLNTVLVVQTLVPFVTAGGQEVFVGQIDSFFPFRNLNTTLKFDNQMMRIARLNTYLNNINLTTDNLIIPYRTNATTVPLRNTDVDFSVLNNYLGLDGLSVSGHGSISLPIEIKEKAIRLSNGEVRLSNVSMKYQGNNAKVREALFRNSNEYLLKSGSISLSQGTDNQLNAWLNFDGRMLPEQIKSNFTGTLHLDPMTLLNTEQPPEVPAIIRERQNSIKTFLGRQK